MQQCLYELVKYFGQKNALVWSLVVYGESTDGLFSRKSHDSRIATTDVDMLEKIWI